MNYLPPTGLAGMQDGVMLPIDSLLVVLYTYKYVLAFVCANQGEASNTITTGTSRQVID